MGVTIAGLVGLVAPRAYADLLTLKSGESLEGFFVRDTDEGVVFRVRGGEERVVPADDVAGLEVGFPGEPFCFERRGAGQDCSALLYQFQSDRLVIATGTGFLELQEIPMSEVERVEIDRESQAPEAFHAELPDGINVEISRSVPPAEPSEGDPSEPEAAPAVRETVVGTVVSRDDVATLIRREDGQIVRIPNEEIRAAVHRPEPEPEPAPVAQPEFEARWYDIMPGVPQYRWGQRGKGSLLFGGFSTLVLGVYWEYLQAQQVSAEAAGDPTVYLFNNTSYLDEFSRHQRMQRLLGYGAGLVFLYHLFDWRYLGPQEAVGTGEAAQASLRPTLRSELVQYYGDAVERRWRLGFEMRF